MVISKNVCLMAIGFVLPFGVLMLLLSFMGFLVRVLVLPLFPGKNTLAIGWFLGLSKLFLVLLVVAFSVVLPLIMLHKLAVWLKKR